MKSKEYLKHLRTGPGGLHCPCCFPQNRKGRRYEFRNLRRIQNAEAKKEIQDACNAG